MNKIKEYFVGLFRLTKGELFKLIKSKTLYIMGIVLAVIIGLFTIFYATLPSTPTNKQSMIDMMMGTKEDPFGAYDMAMKAISGSKERIAKEVSVALGDDKYKANVYKAIDKLTGREFGVKLIREDPLKTALDVSVVHKLLVAKPDLVTQLDPDEELMQFLLLDYRSFLMMSAFDLKTGALDEAKLATIVGEKDLRNKIISKKTEILAIYRQLIANIVAGKINIDDVIFNFSYSILIRNGEVDGQVTNLNSVINLQYREALNEAKNSLKFTKLEMDYFADNNYSKTYVDFIKEILFDFNDAYLAYKTAYTQFTLDGSQTNFVTLTDTFNKISSLAYLLDSETSTLMNEYNFLLYKFDMMDMAFPADYLDFKNPFKAFVKIHNDVSSARSKLSSEQKIYSTLTGGDYALASLKDKWVEPFSNATSPERKALIVRYDNFAVKAEEEGNFFYCYNKKNTEYTEDSTAKERMSVYTDGFDASYSAVFSEKFYKDNILPYSQDIIDVHDKIAVVESTTDYTAFRRISHEIFSKTSTLRSMVINLNAINVFDELKFKDEQAKKVLGMVFSSRYELSSAITEAKYFLDTGKLAIDYASVNNLEKGWGFMSFTSIVVILLVLIFSIVIASGMIAGEQSQGTLKLLLIRPFSKGQVLLSKALTVIIVTIGFLLGAFLLTLIIGAIGWGLGGKSVLAIFNAKIPLLMSQLGVVTLLYVFAFVQILMYAFISLMLSTLFKSRSAAVSISMLVFFAAQILSYILGQFDWYKFIIFNNTDLFSYFSVGPPLNDMNFFFSLVIYIVYFIAIVVTSFVTFIKRDAT